MMHKFNKDFLIIGDQILSENKTIEEWALIESDDMFQKGNYTGGFDATEMEFCFSVIENYKEFWFQLSLETIIDVVEERKKEIEALEADY